VAKETIVNCEGCGRDTKAAKQGLCSQCRGNAYTGKSRGRNQRSTEPLTVRDDMMLTTEQLAEIDDCNAYLEGYDRYDGS
jgi:hypothetical protein